MTIIKILLQARRCELIMKAIGKEDTKTLLKVSDFVSCTKLSNKEIVKEMEEIGE